MDDAQRRCASPPHAARCVAENCAAAGSAKKEPASANPDAATTVNITLFIATPCFLLRCGKALVSRYLTPPRRIWFNRVWKNSGRWTELSTLRLAAPHSNLIAAGEAAP
jgi:hypothetical protein